MVKNDSAVTDYPSRRQEQYVVRLPDGMRDRIKEAAAANGRSMNSEIVARLHGSFVMHTIVWPHPEYDIDIAGELPDKDQAPGEFSHSTSPTPFGEIWERAMKALLVAAERIEKLDQSAKDQERQRRFEPAGEKPSKP